MCFWLNQQSVLVWFFFDTITTNVEVRTNDTFITDTNYWSHSAAIASTCHALTLYFLLRFFFLFLNLSCWERIFLKVVVYLLFENFPSNFLKFLLNDALYNLTRDFPLLSFRVRLYINWFRLSDRSSNCCLCVSNILLTNRN